MRPDGKPVKSIGKELRRALLRGARPERRAAWIRNDPVQYAHRYAAPEDREIAALLGALIAFGSVRAFLPKLRALLECLGPSPRRFVERYRPQARASFFRDFRSRVYTGDDFRLLLAHLREILRERSSLEAAFIEADPRGGRAAHRARLQAFASLFRRLDPRPITGSARRPSGYDHLVADPAKGGACKRWNLFLRWVARPPDGVDLGLWTRVDPSDLVIPLDVHVARIGALVGIRRRRTLDWKAAEEITDHLRILDPADPLRFDFALSHLGISAGCRGRRGEPVCGGCRLRAACSAGGENGDGSLRERGEAAGKARSLARRMDR